MKIFLGLFCVFLSVSCYAAENQCSADYTTVFKDEFPKWIDLDEKSDCFEKAVNQTKLEIDASYTYLNIGAHFARDVINRPGVADFFFKAAKEEREHATKLIEYLSMRGHLNIVEPLIAKKNNTEGKTVLAPPNFKIDISSLETAADAFKHALELEEKVTKSIRSLIKICEEKTNHYHIVDWLTGVYLEEQLHGKRDLAGKLSQLKKMGSGALGEFLFDKTL